jgi:Fic family protein
MVHKELEFIHPFVDGNGRVGRLLINLVLLQAGYVVTVIPPVRRPEYISLLEKAHTDDRPFIEFIAECVLETQKDYLRLLNG